MASSANNSELLGPADLLHSFPKTDPLNRYFVASTEVMLPMRDGCFLATDIHRPSHGDGTPLATPVPVLLVRTSYDKANPEWDDVIPFLARRGIAVAIQDIRNRFRSERRDGRYYHTVNPWEANDGYDTVEWLAAQTWCNGRVGCFGSSHRAITQQQLALAAPPHLVAIFPEVGPTNIFEHEAREGGAFCFAMFAALHMHALDSHEIQGKPEAVAEVFNAMVHIADWTLQTPFVRGQTALRHTPSLEQTLLDYYTRGRYDAWWGQEAANQEAHWHRHADIPTLIAGGWYDQFIGGTCRYWETLRRQNTALTRLIIGPWNHGGTCLLVPACLPAPAPSNKHSLPVGQDPSQVHMQLARQTTG